MVVDASVMVSHLVPHDAHHLASRAWLTNHVDDGGLVIAPVLLLPEIAGAVARRTGAPGLAQRAIDAVLKLPGLRLLTMDEVLGRTAAGLAGRLRLRGADAIYIAAALSLRLPLVTWDTEQRERAARVIEVLIPRQGDSRQKAQRFRVRAIG
jgi:predicted nucleic acid-binding protein